MAFNMHSITDRDLEVALSVDTLGSAEAHAYGLRNIDAWFAHEEAVAVPAQPLPKAIVKVSAPSLDGLVDGQAYLNSPGEAAATAVAFQESELSVEPLSHAKTTSRLHIHNEIGPNKQPTVDAEHRSPIAGSGDAMSIDTAGADDPATSQITPARLSDAEQATISALITLNAAHRDPTMGDIVMNTDLSDHTPPRTMLPRITTGQPPRTPRTTLPHNSGRRTRSTPGAAALRAAMDEEQREGDTPESSPVPFTYARQRGAESVEGDENMATEDFEDVPKVAEVNKGDGDSELKGRKRKLAVSTGQKPSKRSKHTDSAAPSSMAKIALGDNQSDIVKSGEGHHELELGIASADTKLPAQAQKSTPPKSTGQAKDSKPVISRRSTMANELKALTGKTTSKRQPVAKQSPKPALGSQSRPKKVTSQLPSESGAAHVFAAETGAIATPAGELEQMLPGIDVYFHPEVQAPQSAVSGRLKKLAVADEPKVKTQRRSARFSGAATEELGTDVKAEGKSKENVALVKPNGVNTEPAKQSRGRPARAGPDGVKGGC
ncbi:hypothetical protein B0A48_07457 [Cryoendolithus antarcticus]|uniref:Uncharacterized protein n=1 Tax=Cryoendolithus antarcticus TaxID=1507870 RepID=A0A1V8T6K3_9PEZI|nr:hypothetical protein B0A48_07457 [Cryoendolithus antarcticus]